MPFPVLVVDRHAAVQKVGQLGRAERLFDLDREQGLDLVEEEAAVAVGACDQRFARFTGHGKTALLDRLRAANQFFERGMVEPPKDQHLAAREKRRVELEARVLGGRSDQRHRAVLDIRQEAVLLRAVEAVHFVHEQQGVLAGLRHLPRFGKNLLEVGDSGKDRRDGDEP